MRPSQAFGLSLFASSAWSYSEQELKANFWLYSQYSDAAYCPSATDGYAEHALCESEDPSTCLGLANTTTTVKEFDSSGLPGLEKYDISGYVAKDPVKKTIVVVFRGTSTFKDVLTDLFFTMGDTKFGDNEAELCRDCRVHNGFRAAFSSVREHVLDVVQDVKKDSQYKKVVVTGHSLGGAVATLASAYLRKKGHDCDLYTYGSPRVGNRQFARFVEQQSKGDNYRIVNQLDIVAAIPLAGLGRFPWLLRNRYDHIFPQWWYKDGLARTGNPYSARFEHQRQNMHSTCIKDSSIFGISGPRDMLSCKVRDHRVYANVDLQNKVFKPCGVQKARAEEADEDEVGQEELQMLSKSLGDSLEDAAVHKACAGSCEPEEGESCQPVAIRRLQDGAKCRCRVRLAGKSEEEERDEIECDENRGDVRDVEV